MPHNDQGVPGIESRVLDDEGNGEKPKPDDEV